MDLEIVSSNSESSVSKKFKQDDKDIVAIGITNSTGAVESELSYNDEEDDDGDDGGNYFDDGSDYYDNDDNMYDNEEDNYEKMLAQFDSVDAPPGVEISLPWLKDPAPSLKMSSLLLPDAAPSEIKIDAAASTSTTITDEEKREDEILIKFQQFNRFDTVEDFLDHHYIGAGLSGQNIPDKKWVKKIQEEWKILENNLPDTIYVRVCEARMDLLKAVIVGPAGTPYHDGLFTFDAVFPPNYPNEPPMVYYYSGGLRLNPNLYECGKVCLSLLHTWSGQQTEMWIPEKSTMLQVLVSIQALILNTNPYFNEPGYEDSRGSSEGKKRSQKYNDDVFIMSLKTMLYTLRNPPKHFESLVVGHFYRRAREILDACKAYTEKGVLVGSTVKEAQTVDDGRIQHCNESGFTTAVQRMMKLLITFFTKNGSKDLEQFQPHIN